MKEKLEIAVVCENGPQLIFLAGKESCHRYGTKEEQTCKYQINSKQVTLSTQLGQAPSSTPIYVWSCGYKK